MLDAEADDREAALREFLGAALSNKWNITSWCNTLLQVINDPRDELADIGHAIAMTAYHVHGDRILDEMADIANAQPEGFPVGEFLSMMELAVRVAPDPTQVDLPQPPPTSSHETLELNPDLGETQE